MTVTSRHTSPRTPTYLSWTASACYVRSMLGSTTLGGKSLTQTFPLASNARRRLLCCLPGSHKRVLLVLRVGQVWRQRSHPSRPKARKCAGPRGHPSGFYLRLWSRPIRSICRRRGWHSPLHEPRGSRREASYLRLRHLGFRLRHPRCFERSVVAVVIA